MGNLVSFVDLRQTNPTTEESPSQTTPQPPTSSRMADPPRHINIGPPPVLGKFSLSPSSSPSNRDNPLESPPVSPPLVFYTAPSTPITSPQIEDPPRNSSAIPADLTLYVRSPSPSLDSPRAADLSSFEMETIPPADALPSSDFALDFTLDDEGLSVLEKIYLFSRSKSTYHRVFISHALPSFLEQVPPLEAVEYVLPLISGLAMDEEDAVKEALASELVAIMWWFFTHCIITEDPSDQLSPDVSPQPAHSDEVTLISVQAFTPILGTLLLSPNSSVGGPARFAVVDLLARMRRVDDHEAALREGRAIDPATEVSDCGLFGRRERVLFEEELVQQVVIGIGRLEGGDDDGNEQWHDALGGVSHPGTPGQFGLGDAAGSARDANVNPYFPPMSSFMPSTSTATFPPSSSAMPSPPPGVPPPRRETEYLSTELSAMASLSLRRESIDAATAPQSQPAPLPTYTPLPEPPSDTQSQGLSASPHGERGDDTGGDTMDPREQAAIGRLSSMSLMAAVTASGHLTDDRKCAFVQEVERVGRDSVYWVRRESSFALGALAKVVPAEIVISSLLPLFESLRADPIWHVRHSALFALPAILSRLSPSQRRSLALNTVLSMSRDDSAAVRSAVLEALGEIVYTFHEDADGPPRELLRLFVGREADRRGLEDRQLRGSGLNRPSPGQQSTMDLFYRDPVRPLACAFNYPAVALTLGRERWDELSGQYLLLAQNHSIPVRRTLAASIGELAKIIGPENARRDLSGVWWSSVCFEEDGGVRLKAIQATPTLVSALEDERSTDDIIAGLLKIWEEQWLRGWREREAVISILLTIQGIERRPRISVALLKKGLEDNVAAVREAAIDVVSNIWKSLGTWTHMIDDIRAEILTLARSASYRKRMTFVACQQALISSSKDEEPVTIVDAAFWRAFVSLADDSIVGVRIGVARLAGVIYDIYARQSRSAPMTVVQLIRHLQRDPSREVASFIPAVVDHPVIPTYLRQSKSSSTFSRPPPVALDR